jgi:hypothetical protein
VAVSRIDEPEDGRLFLHGGVDVLKARAYVIEGESFAEGEVEIFGKAVIGEVGTLECCASFERKNGLQIGLGECVQEPGEAVIPFEDVFANAQPPCSRETIRKQGDVSPRNHSKLRAASSSSAEMLSCSRHLALYEPSLGSEGSRGT